MGSELEKLVNKASLFLALALALGMALLAFIC